MRRARLLLSVSLILILVVAMTVGCTRHRPRPTPTPVGELSTELTPTPAPTLSRPEPTFTPTMAAEEIASPAGEAPTPVPTPTSAVPPIEKTAEYTVQPGDTLFSIAQRLRTDVDTLRRLNRLSEDTISAGQVLQVPAGALTAASTATPVPGQVIEHVVQRGEYLAIIANKYGVSVSSIVRANNLRNANFVYPGQKLIIPAPGTTMTAPTPTRTAGSAASGKIHVVRRGETLQSIALKYGVTVRELSAANRIRNPNLIYVGQRLVIP
ncbi:MAG: LysM peptidoglycan-binding domain-containing protein [Anaerolineae bacterium]|nr:LysM peptidoglycan-binding domain-containing protein [Anaerolineae bacterium]MDW8099909.1 LysM peptidoglycan-binding domain-containing protein [Anaerolineae bacterium]